MIHTKVKKALAKYHGELPAVAEGSGVPYRTLQKLASGEIKNPGINTVQRVIDWLSKNGAFPKQ